MIRTLDIYGLDNVWLNKIWVSYRCLSFSILRSHKVTTPWCDHMLSLLTQSWSKHNLQESSLTLFEPYAIQKSCPYAVVKYVLYCVCTHKMCVCVCIKKTCLNFCLVHMTLQSVQQCALLNLLGQRVSMIGILNFGWVGSNSRFTTTAPSNSPSTIRCIGSDPCP